MGVAMPNDGSVQRLLEAIGSSVEGVRRVVIDIAPDAPVTVYVQRYLHEEEADAIADMLEGPGAVVEEVEVLDVDDKGDVTVKRASSARIDDAMRDLSFRARRALCRLTHRERWSLPDSATFREKRFVGAQVLSDLVGITADDILNLKNCGPTTCHEIAKWLAGHGVKVLGWKL